MTIKTVSDLGLSEKRVEFSGGLFTESGEVAVPLDRDPDRSEYTHAAQMRRPIYQVSAAFDARGQLAVFKNFVRKSDRALVPFSVESKGLFLDAEEFAFVFDSRELTAFVKNLIPIYKKERTLKKNRDLVRLHTEYLHKVLELVGASGGAAVRDATGKKFSIPAETLAEIRDILDPRFLARERKETKAAEKQGQRAEKEALATAKKEEEPSVEREAAEEPERLKPPLARPEPERPTGPEAPEGSEPPEIPEVPMPRPEEPAEITESPVRIEPEADVAEVVAPPPHEESAPTSADLESPLPPEEPEPTVADAVAPPPLEKPEPTSDSRDIIIEKMQGLLGQVKPLFRNTHNSQDVVLSADNYFNSQLYPLTIMIGVDEPEIERRLTTVARLAEQLDTLEKTIGKTATQDGAEKFSVSLTTYAQLIVGARERLSRVKVDLEERLHRLETERQEQEKLEREGVNSVSSSNNPKKIKLTLESKGMPLTRPSSIRVGYGELGERLAPNLQGSANNIYASLSQQVKTAYEQMIKTVAFSARVTCDIDFYSTGKIDLKLTATELKLPEGQMIFPENMQKLVTRFLEDIKRTLVNFTSWPLPDDTVEGGHIAIQYKFSFGTTG